MVRVGRTERFRHHHPSAGRRRSSDHLTEVSWTERWWSEPAPATRKRSPIWHQVSDTLLGVARRILRDPTLAEDVLQNALVTIWRKLPHLREADRFEGWAFRILVHACYAEAPRNRRWASAIRVLHADVASDVDDIQMITDRDELEQAFRRLPLDQRAVFVLHHHVGLPPWRWPRRSASRTGRRDHGCTTQPGRFAPPLSRRGRRRISEKDVRHERQA